MRRFFASIARPPDVRFLWEPRGTWPDNVVHSLCRDLGLVHAVDPFVRPSLTPELTYWRLHGNRSHYASYTDDELRQLHAWIDPGVETYVMFNNIPRVGDAKRFRALLSPAPGPQPSAPPRPPRSAPRAAPRGARRTPPRSGA